MKSTYLLILKVRLCAFVRLDMRKKEETELLATIARLQKMHGEECLTASYRPFTNTLYVVQRSRMYVYHYKVISKLLYKSMLDDLST